MHSRAMDTLAGVQSKKLLLLLLLPLDSLASWGLLECYLVY